MKHSKMTGLLLIRLIRSLPYMNFKIIVYCVLCYIESTDSMIPITIAQFCSHRMVDLFQTDLATDVK